jgi:hypothetical protein
MLYNSGRLSPFIRVWARQFVHALASIIILFRLSITERCLHLVLTRPIPIGILTETTPQSACRERWTLAFDWTTFSNTLQITSTGNWYLRLKLIPIGLSFWFITLWKAIPSRQRLHRLVSSRSHWLENGPRIGVWLRWAIKTHGELCTDRVETYVLLISFVISNFCDIFLSLDLFEDFTCYHTDSFFFALFCRVNCFVFTEVRLFVLFYTVVRTSALSLMLRQRLRLPIYYAGARVYCVRFCWLNYVTKLHRLQNLHVFAA